MEREGFVEAINCERTQSLGRFKNPGGIESPERTIGHNLFGVSCDTVSHNLDSILTLIDLKLMKLTS
jgi:hypothetical protein